MGKVARVLLALAMGALAVIAAPRAVAASPILHGGPIGGWMATTVPVPANDVAYDAVRQQLLVTVQSHHASMGNELVEISPVNGALGRRVLVGSNPGRVVVSDDGAMAYVGLRGANELVRVDLSTFTVAARIDLGLNTAWGPHVVDDIEAMPGRNDLVVASLGIMGRSSTGRLVVAYEDDEALPSTVFSMVEGLAATSPTTVFGVASTLGWSRAHFTIDASGVSGADVSSPPGVTYYGAIEARFGRVYSTAGRIFDSTTGAAIGSFDGFGQIEVTADGQITVVDPASASIEVFDATTGALLASRLIGGLHPSTALVATGSGFALAAGAQGVTLLGSVVSSAGFAPPAPPANGIADLQHLTLPYEVNDALFDPSRDRLYASVASTSPNRGNQVVAIDPTSGAVVASVAVGNDPGPLAMDEGATRLHVGRNGNGRIDTIDLGTFSSLGGFVLGTEGFETMYARQIEVRPGTDDELVVALQNSNGRPRIVALYVDGARRPSTIFGPGHIALGGGPTVWAMDGEGETSRFYELEVDDAGVHLVAQHTHLAAGREFTLHDGRLYTSYFRVLDPEVPSVVGTLPFAGPVVGDAVAPRMYVFEGISIRAVDDVSLRTVGIYEHGLYGATAAVSTQVGDEPRFALIAEHLTLVTQRLPGTGTFHPVAPARLADSRTGHGLSSRLSAGVPQQLQVTGVGGVPSSGVAAVVVNLTAVGSSTSSYVTAWPAGLERPRASNLNYRAGRVVANQAVVPVGAGGRISLVVDSGVTHLVVDVQGWFGDGTEVPGSRLNTLRPARLADSRIGNGLPTGRLTAGTPRSLQVTGRLGVPSSGVSAVVVNLTSVAPTANSYLTAWPTGLPRPTSSNLNFAAGQVVANQAIIPVGAGGRINLAVAAGATHVVVDVQGWFGPAGSASGSLFHASPPARIVDSRVPVGMVGILHGRSVRPVPVGGSGGVPMAATAVVANLTVVQPNAGGHLVAWPTGLAMPITSNVNFSANQVVANQAIVPIGSWGRISVYSNNADTHLVIDVQGWFAAT